MRKIVFVGALLVLASCARSSPLPPDDVLRRASQATQDLASARYVISGELTSGKNGSSRGTGNIEGILQDSGKQTQFTLVLAGSFANEGRSYAANGSMEVIVAWNQELFLFLKDLVVEPSHPLLDRASVELFRGKWWKIPDATKGGASLSVTPDPRMLEAQAEVVKIDRDRGMDTIDGRSVYHYDVSLDSEKLVTYMKSIAEERGETLSAEELREKLKGLTATGELWIDAETFFVHRLTWDVRKEDAGDGDGFQLQFTANLREFNAAPLITPPKEFEMFSPFIFLGGSQVMDAGASNLSDNTMKALLQELQEGEALFQGTSSSAATSVTP